MKIWIASFMLWNVSGHILLGDFLDTNILAVAVGYQTERTLPSGVSVPAFSLEEAAGDGNEKGVLFAVVAPTNLCGKFFWLAHEGPIDNSGSSFYDHSPDGVYAFKFGKLSDDPYQLAEEDLFSMPSPVRYLCTIRPYGRRVFLSRKEVESRLELIDKRIDKSKKELEELIREIKALALDKRKMDRLLGRIEVLRYNIDLYEKHKQYTKLKSDEIESNRKILFRAIPNAEPNNEEKGRNEVAD